MIQEGSLSQDFINLVSLSSTTSIMMGRIEY
nr:MAG TPA: hypothetical protein [Caudoviricetes sp.]DAW00199.1 MAG TPA: hypothetical protein [Caudoviricetes sp.]